MSRKYNFNLLLLGFIFIFSFLTLALSFYNNSQNTSTNRPSTQNLSLVLSETNSPTPACYPPSSGCPYNYYWDSGSCSCHQYNLTPYPCSEPSGGCGTNYRWDSSSCSCASIQPTSCSPPSTGCGTNYYWDYYYCACKPSSGTSSCSAPSVGCGSNYYWDTASCSCKPSSGTSSCTQPSSGCGTDKYWDSNLCTCKSYSSGTGGCNQPSTGCGYNYYWDSNTCSCKINPEVTTCPSPTSACTNGTYWDSYSCSCKLNYPYYQQANFDRLAYEPIERIDCIKSKLSQYEYERLRYFVPTVPQEQSEVSNLGNKVSSCWEYSTSQEAQGGVNPTQGAQSYKAPYEYEACLLRKLGQKAYSDIYYGLRKPAYDEQLVYEECLGGVRQASPIVYYTNENSFSKETSTCLRQVLKNDYSKVKAGHEDVPYESREQVNKCFGINPQPFEEGRTYKVPVEVRNCLVESLGQDRFNQINTGGNPNEEEKSRAQECFSQLHKEQLNFLPPPPEQVPFLEEAPDIINFSQVKQETQKVKNKDFGGKVVLAGKAPPNSSVTIYIYSEPIVVTTKTDENGDWIYELEQPLSGEKHVAYATVKTTSGKIVKSSVLDFTVIAAEEDIQNRLISETELSQNSGKRLVTTAFVVIGAALFVLMVGLALYHMKKVEKGVVNNQTTTSIKVVKRNGTEEDYNPEKVIRVLKVSGLTEEEAKKLASSVTAWLKEDKKDKVTSLQIRDKVVVEVQKVNKVAADKYISYEKYKDKNYGVKF